MAHRQYLAFVVPVLGLVCFQIWLLGALTSDHSAKKSVSTTPRNNKVILLGPHDRYNFGDIIFSQVVAKLLTSRAGYSDEDILYGGVVSTNMTAYGGPSSVLSMKEVQSLSLSDAEKGPYDIIYTGGQALTCTVQDAANMLPTKELRSKALKERAHECAYLFPKRLLRKPNSWLSWLSGEHPQNESYAIINSLGGNKVGKACQEAVDTADYAAYRDHHPLYPDSAVMMKELFPEEINKAAHEVLLDLDFSDEQTFIAVQSYIFADHTPKQLASALDMVARGMDATVVFFAAGTAPRHDSFDSYKEVAAIMNEPTIVYEAENMWKVIGLISRAKAVLSTSLHVRIISFLYFKPRVTWCELGNKHSQFIEMWDSATSSPCVMNVSDSLDFLRKHYLTNPQASTEQAMTSYQRTVNKYLESFVNYSGLLRP